MSNYWSNINSFQQHNSHETYCHLHQKIQKNFNLKCEKILLLVQLHKNKKP